MSANTVYGEFQVGGIYVKVDHWVHFTRCNSCNQNLASMSPESARELVRCLAAALGMEVKQL